MTFYGAATKETAVFCLLRFTQTYGIYMGIAHQKMKCVVVREFRGEWFNVAKPVLGCAWTLHFNRLL